jgi:prenyltransferase beta subunit
MNSKEPQASDVKENCFRILLTFLRMAGVPVNKEHASILHSTYSALTAINAYALCLAFYMDSITHNDDLKNFIRNFQALNSTSVLHWLHLYSR